MKKLSVKFDFVVLLNEIFSRIDPCRGWTVCFLKRFAVLLPEVQTAKYFNVTGKFFTFWLMLSLNLCHVT